jgi:Peptidase of plants and bacteria
MKCPIRLILAVLLVEVPFETLHARGPTANPSPVRATVHTTLTTSAGQIRQFAFDGDPHTFFASAEKPETSDHFTLNFDDEVEVTSIGVVTGLPDGSGSLGAGDVEVSADGRMFAHHSKIADGHARMDLRDTRLRAVRIKPTRNLPHALVIREITITSNPPVATFRYPVEFVVDVADAPEMRAWAVHVAEVCERAYPMINDELESPGFTPPSLVRMALRKRYRGVAAAGGGRITGSVNYFKDHPHDVGAMVHETVHIVQNYQGQRENPGWLVEGVADYVRFFKFEPGRIGRIDADRAHYNNSYRVTAAFLDYLTETYHKPIVPVLNRAMREGRYDEKLFQELTGKSPNDLDADWRKTLKR